MEISKTEKLENTEFEYINNCCKRIYAKLHILDQCKYLRNDMIKLLADWVREDVATIQENCIDLLEGN